MSAAAWVVFLILIALVVLSAVPLGRYIATVCGHGPAPGDRFFSSLERFIYQVCRINPMVVPGCRTHRDW